MTTSSEAGGAAEVEIVTRGLLFDMDGVLISSIGSVERCWREWARVFAVPDAGAYHVPHGTRAVDVIRILKPEWNEAQVAAGLLAIEDLEIADVAGTEALAGARSLLQRLPEDRWAIVTSATRRLLLVRLAAAGLPVAARLISGDMVVKGKPDPEPYRRGAEALGLDPSDCVVLEDAPAGVGAGIAAGCRVLGVLGTHTAAELAQATWRVRSLAELRVEVSATALRITLPRPA